MEKSEKIIKSISKNPIKLGLSISRIHWKFALSAIFFVILANAVAKINVVIISNITDSIGKNSNVWFWAILYPAIYIISQTLWRLSGFTGALWFSNLSYTATNSLYRYLSLHSKEYFSNRFAGTLTNKISNAADGIEELFELCLWQFLPLILSVFWFTLFTFLKDYRLGLIIFVWSVLFISINIRLAKKLQPTAIAYADSQSELKGRVVDSITNISLVHESAYIDKERLYIKNYVHKVKTANLNLWWKSEWMLFVNVFLIFIFILSILGTSIVLFQQKIITAGVIIMIIAIILNISDQMLFLSQQIRNASRQYGTAKEGLSEIIQGHQITDTHEAAVLKIEKPEITLTHIDFDYQGKKVFENFSLHIKAGEKIGIVGKSGAGKTTLVSLLLRHYEPQKGQIAISGQNINHVTLESLRRNISLVPQDTNLFHRSIKDNIKYAKPDASDEEMLHAAKLAQADEFISQMPEQYESVVGERGIKLSGGQRQRLAIARSFIKNAPILILDEATSSLDSASEHAIQLSLEKLMQGRTVIAIAHRLSTLKNMDRIVVIENGNIVEDGTPDNLLTKPDGIFKNLWDHQIKGFIVDS